jgi:hypothetical protein
MMDDFGEGPSEDNVVKSRPPTEADAQTNASPTDAAKALNEIYEDIKGAPKYLRVSHLIKDYNTARQKYDQQDFNFVVNESVRIKDLLHNMKEDYNNVALQVIKAQETLQEFQGLGFNMDYVTFFKMLDDCQQVLKRGELETATGLFSNFEGMFQQQRQDVLEPVRQDAHRIMQGISQTIEQAQWDNIDTTKAEDRYAEILDAMNKAQSFSEFQSLVEQTEDIKDLLDDARNEKAMKDELPKQISVKIQKARLELINLRKMNMDIESQIDQFDAITSKFTNADDKDEFARIDLDIEKLNGQIEARKQTLQQILDERQNLNVEIQRRTHKISELTQKGYLMAAMTNKVEKATQKLNTEASQDAIKQTKRFISNFDAELTSIEAQDIEEFNLRIRLLSDFEQLSDLYDKLEDDIDDVMEFLVEFSQFFSEAQGVEDFKKMDARMRDSLNAVKKSLGMPIEEVEEVIPQEEVTMREEFVSDTDKSHLPPPPPD